MRWLRDLLSCAYHRAVGAGVHRRLALLRRAGVLNAGLAVVVEVVAVGGSSEGSKGGNYKNSEVEHFELQRVN